MLVEGRHGCDPAELHVVFAPVAMGQPWAPCRPSLRLGQSGWNCSGGPRPDELTPSHTLPERIMTKTLIILKPDCMAKKLAGSVVDRFEKAGFEIIGAKMIRLTPEILRDHYAHVASKPFYPEIEQFMSSRPVIVLALQGENVVARVRDLLGPTDSRKAPKGTIRGDFGTDMMTNVVHASDSDENARIELARFFRPGELFA